jgi:hypothetical protein
LRRESANHTDKEVDRLHADGSYIRSVFTLHGPSTVYRDGRTERSVAPGTTIFMTAIGRARTIGVPCTLHRRPGRGMERTVIVCSFEPRSLVGSGVALEWSGRFVPIHRDGILADLPGRQRQNRTVQDIPKTGHSAVLGGVRVYRKE